jgi:hypothetical protein
MNNLGALSDTQNAPNVRPKKIEILYSLSWIPWNGPKNHLTLPSL